MPNPDEATLNALLHQGIAACQAGDLAAGRQALIAALRIDPQSETGWLWLSSALTEPGERRACLQRVLSINPGHAAARSGLEWLDQHFPPVPAPPAKTAAPSPAVSLPPTWTQTPAVEDVSEPAASGWPPAASPWQTTAAAPSAAEAEEPAAAQEEAWEEWPPLASGGATAPLSAGALDELEAERPPDWLTAALQRAEREAPEPEPVEERPLERPDWLRAALPPAEEAIEAEGEAAEGAARPDWLEAALRRAEAGQQPEAAPSEAVEEEEDEGEPDWLREVNRREGEAAAGEAAEELAPEWPGVSEAETLVEADVLEAEPWSAEPAAPPVARAPQRVRPDSGQCPWCAEPVSALDVSCPNCRRPLELECPACRYSVSLEETQCPNCGRAFGDFSQRETYLRNLGEAYLGKEMHQQALFVYRQLAEAAPGEAQHHARLLRVLGRLGLSQESIPVAQRLLELDPENADALERLGRWYAVQGEFDALAEIVERLNKIKQPAPRLSLLLGDLEFERRQYPAAFRAYRQAAAQPDFDPPTVARLHYRLGEMYLAAEDTLEALHAFQACVAAGADIHETEQARARIAQIRPPLPPSATRSANETLRAMAGPLLLVWLTGAIQVGLRFGNLNAAAVVGMFAAVPGSYLVASAVSTPTAIEWRTLLGPKGLSQPMFGALAALLGAAILATALALILFGQQ